MGMPASKFGQEIEQEEPAKGSLPSTPILTPKTYRLNDLDPRSPSENIVRTPIEVHLAKNEKSVSTDSKKVSPLANNDELTKKIYLPTVKLKSIDPRSPTVDFVRTPIVVPENDISFPLKLHNKNFDNVRKTLLVSPLTQHIKKGLRENIVSPKLLESNVISPKPIESKRKSYVGLLETNLDFIETDLDKVQPKIEVTEDECIYLSKKEESENESSECIEKVEEYLIATPAAKVSTLAPTLTSYHNGDVSVNDPSDPRSCSSYFIKTPIPILQRLETLAITDDSASKEDILPTDISITYDDFKAQQKSPEKDVDKPQCDDNLKQNEQNKAETVKGFDRKLSKLIYEDKKSENTIRNKKACDVRSRMPLGTRNSNTHSHRGISKLKVHDKPRKSLRDFSKIPVFQHNTGKGKFSQQCENTPPGSFSDIRVEKQQWDPDNTVII